HIDGRLKPFFGEMKLTSITSGDVRRYVSELVRGTGIGSNPRAVHLARARAAAERLREFTVTDLARELDVSTDSARKMIGKLEREGSVARTGGEVRRAARGRRHRLYALRGRGEIEVAGASERISNKTINNSVMVLRL